MTHCTYCINEPKKADYLVNGEKAICKSCINNKIYQRMLRANGDKITFIGVKKVNRYNLPLDHKYRVVGFNCVGSVFDGGGSSCDNCGRYITNVAMIENEEGKQFGVGTDCAETLSLLDTNDFWKLKEQEALYRKMMGWAKKIKDLMTKGDVRLEIEGGTAWIYFNGSLAFRLRKETYDTFFSKMNIPERIKA